MSFKEAVNAWNIRQHLYVWVIGVAIIAAFSLAISIIALAFYLPGAFLALVAFIIVSYIFGVIATVLFLDSQEPDGNEGYE